jgi:hypothetical protein
LCQSPGSHGRSVYVFGVRTLRTTKQTRAPHTKKLMWASFSYIMRNTSHVHVF